MPTVEDDLVGRLLGRPKEPLNSTGAVDEAAERIVAVRSTHENAAAGIVDAYLLLGPAERGPFMLRACQQGGVPSRR